MQMSSFMHKYQLPYCVLLLMDDSNATLVNNRIINPSINNPSSDLIQLKTLNSVVINLVFGPLLNNGVAAGGKEKAPNRIFSKRTLNLKMSSTLSWSFPKLISGGFRRRFDAFKLSWSEFRAQVAPPTWFHSAVINNCNEVKVNVTGRWVRVGWPLERWRRCQASWPPHIRP